MKNAYRGVLVLMLVAGFGMTLPAVLLAGEHGGKEHGGAAPAAAAKEHGGAAPAETGEAAVLKEAAAALRKGESRPDLADKLEKLAEAHAAH